MKSYLDVTTKYLKCHFKRTLLTILGIIMSVALLSGLATIYYSYKDYNIAEAKKNYGDYEVSFKNINKAQIDTVKNHPAVYNIGISIPLGYGKIYTETRKDVLKKTNLPHFRYLEINAMDSNCLKSIFKPILVKGRYPQNNHEILVEKDSLKFIGKNININSKIKFPLGKIQEPKEIEDSPKNDSPNKNIFIPQNECEYTIVGIIKDDTLMSYSTHFTGITLLENTELCNKTSTDNVFTLYSSLSSKNNKREISKTIANSIGIVMDSANFDDSDNISFNAPLLRLHGESNASIIDSKFNLTILFMAFIIIICTIAIIYNSINISVLERISEFGILRSIGATPAQIRKMVFKESFIISIIGIPFGIISGVLGTKIVLYIAGTVLMKNGFDPFKVFIYPGVIIISIILGLITIFLSTFGPSITAGRVSPLEAIKNSRSYKVGKFKNVSKGKVSKLLFKVEGQLAYRNMTRNKKRFIVTVFSLVISIIMFISFNSFADYMKLQDKPNIPLCYDTHYISECPITKSEYNDISNQPQIENIYTRYKTQITIPIPINKYNEYYTKLSGTDLNSYKFNNFYTTNDSSFLGYDKNLLNLSKNNLLSGSCNENDLDNMGVILVNTNVINLPNRKEAKINFTKYKIGDTIKFPKLKNYPIYGSALNSYDEKEIIQSNSFYELKIVGILNNAPISSDTPHDGISIITSIKTYEKIIKNLDIFELYFKLKPNADRNALKAYFINKPEIDFGHYSDFKHAKEEDQKIYFQISIFVYGFISIISLIGAINIINTITTNLLIRRREFAVLKSIGMSQNQLKKMVLLEGAFHGIVASLFGSILGSICSWILYNINSPLMVDVHWSLPLKAILISTIGTIIISLISSLFPLRKISKDSIIENIRIEE
ncbi:FtsX-like permease family protein [Clostridium botulinum]|uniref:ABC transporter, ATP-binding protein n=1 Tax=Clostridium botulinum D str. 1873 TaxID=592027 RepID=A0A9P2LLZ1_CLOBO|nr:MULTISPECIES: FtsX-like permease family protein [Clostridium]NFV47673.1 FtsX-like permease family protein [Clostridium botulinum]AYF54329.1 ABC transporter ATP-binding protein [Clostridium novyi]EES92094.1 ABC transporter, ATP-binding protein [Clostridium botulinum D str. 1873]MBO3442260.1 FtsX-like permease family protein [Clostridium haemolyticum]MCD3246276.1 FtsX-like permease family protein [Clostridium botulinum C]